MSFIIMVPLITSEYLVLGKINSVVRRYYLQHGMVRRRGGALHVGDTSSFRRKLQVSLSHRTIISA